MNDSYPERIVCLTEETTETLYLLGEDCYTKRINDPGLVPLYQQLNQLAR